MSRTVANLLSAKGRDVFSIEPEASVLDALRTMETHRVGALVVTKDGALAGIISERDFAREMVNEDRKPSTMLVSDIMTSDVHTVGPDASLEECMSEMTDKRIRHLPIMDGTELIGVVSIGDVVKAVITDQEHLIEDLERYITG